MMKKNKKSFPDNNGRMPSASIKSVWSRTKEQFNKMNSTFFMVALIMSVVTVLVASSVMAAVDTTRPVILSVSPVNNEQKIGTSNEIVIEFSEDMNPSTLNANTITVMQRTTPLSGAYRELALTGTITNSGRTVTFNPDERFYPNQEFGNVFTVMVTTGAKDVAGNSLAQNYVTSFTTGGNPFNTGSSTTSQTSNTVNQELMAGTTSPITGQATSSVTKNSFPWIWVIGGGILVVMLGFIFVFGLSSIGRRDQKEKIEKKIEKKNPFGGAYDIHPVMEIEGIGVKYNKALHAMGIKNTKQLWEADASKVARTTGAPLSAVKNWQSMAELSSVKDIGPQYAELLARSGVQSIEQLKNYEPEKLLRLVRRKEDSLKVNIQGNSPGQATIENWIGEARDHKFSNSEQFA